MQLEPGDILIQDGDRPVALAGIMGGANSQIEDDTTSIILESAAFPANQIRRTAKRLGIHSESSKRFEKGTDLAAVAAASERAASLLRDSVNANVYHPPIDTNEYGVKESILSVDMRDIRKVTGIKGFSSELAADLLESIGISSHKKSVNILSVRLPTFRPDLRESVDIIEEVARLNGYDAIPQNYPVSISAFERMDESQYDFEQRAKHIMSSLGLRETIHYSFTSEESLRGYGLLPDNAVRIQNPISEEMKVLRTSLMPSLLQTYLYNKNRRTFDQKLFEVGKIYFQDSEEETQVKETPYIGGLLSGYLTPPSWKGKGPQVDFYSIKGVVETLVRQLTSVTLAFEPLRDSKLLHPNRGAILKLGSKEVGFIGEIHPYVRQKTLDTTESVVLFELNLDVLRRYERSVIRYISPSRFPSVELDIALMVDKPVTSQMLLETIKHVGGNLLYDADTFDLYEGENIPQGKKSLAFHLVFQSHERTLLETEVTTLRETIVQNLGEKYGAQLRA